MTADKLERDSWLSHVIGMEAFWLPRDFASISRSFRREGVFLQLRTREKNQKLASSLGFFELEEIIFRSSWTISQCPEHSLTPAGLSFDLASPNDTEALVMLGTQVLRHSRFASDPNIPSEWHGRVLRQSFLGAIDESRLIAARETKTGAVIGLCSMVPSSTGDLRLGHIAVDPEFRGRGLALALVSSCLGHSGLQAGDNLHLTARTQANNSQAVRFYENSGFKIFSREFLYQKLV